MRIIFFTVISVLLTTAVSGDAAVVYPFEGSVNFKTKKFNVSIQSKELGKASFEGEPKADHDFELKVVLDHFQFRDMDVSADVATTISKSINVNKESVYTGRISSQYLLVDYKPVREITGSFFAKDRLLTLRSFRIGGVNANGSVELRPPYAINLAINLDRIPMNQFLDVWAPDRTYESDGEVSGLIKLSRNAYELYVNGKLKGNDGYIKTFGFDDIRLDIEGIYPNLQISKSRVLKKDGVSFEFEGPINLKDMKNVKQQIQELTYLPVVRGTELEREWTIRQVRDDTVGKTTLKYMLRKETDGTSNENSAILGIEKSLEF